VVAVGTEVAGAVGTEVAGAVAASISSGSKLNQAARIQQPPANKQKRRETWNQKQPEATRSQKLPGASNSRL